MSHMRTSKTFLLPQFQKPLARTSPLASSLRVLAVLVVGGKDGVALFATACDLLLYKMVGLITTRELVRSMPQRWAHSLCMSLR